jgi:hypothetical protein
MIRKIAIPVLSALCSLSAFAQWNKLPSPIPPGADGKPNLTAPAPRLADGKPDLSGIWQANGPKYLRNITADMKPAEIPFQPWAKQVFDQRQDGRDAKIESDANCLPQGVPKINATPVPYKFIQAAGEIVILYEAFNLWRQVFMDGRELMKELNPTWLGYSVGRWEGDTLVIDTRGFNGKTWLDQAGLPTTDALHITERFRRKDFGHMEMTVTIDDPKAYTKPWTVTEDPVLQPGTELLEFICGENERDVAHLK